jgi:hypothetical protein
MLKRTIKILGVIIIVLILLLLVQLFVIRPIVALILSGSPEYVYRSYVWGDSDIQDYEKYPLPRYPQRPTRLSIQASLRCRDFPISRGLRGLVKQKWDDCVPNNP